MPFGHDRKFLLSSLKAVSSTQIRAGFHREIRHLLWGKGSGRKVIRAISVGDGATTPIIERYIQSQKRPH